MLNLNQIKLSQNIHEPCKWPTIKVSTNVLAKRFEATSELSRALFLMSLKVIIVFQELYSKSIEYSDLKVTKDF